MTLQQADQVVDLREGVVQRGLRRLGLLQDGVECAGGFRARRSTSVAARAIRLPVAEPKRRVSRRCGCEAWLRESFLWQFSLDEVAERPAQVDAKLWW